MNKKIANKNRGKKGFFNKKVLKALGSLPIQIFMGLVALIWFIPTVGLLFQSLRSGADIGQSGWWTVFSNPRLLSFDSYLRLLQEMGMTSAFWSTFKITIPTTILVVFLGASAAYALSWIEFKGKDTLFLVVIGLMVVPTNMAFIPVAHLYRTLGIFGSIYGVILFHLAFGLPFAVFMIRNFFVGIPRELLEAARVDGANHYTLFIKVMVPLAMPAIASLSILQFLWVWNDMLIALIFADPGTAPLTTAIFRQMRGFSSNVDIIAPGAFIQLLVPLIVFFAFQRYFVQGIMGGAVKE